MFDAFRTFCSSRVALPCARRLCLHGSPSVCPSELATYTRWLYTVNVMTLRFLMANVYTCCHFEVIGSDPKCTCNLLTSGWVQTWNFTKGRTSHQPRGCSKYCYLWWVGTHSWVLIVCSHIPAVLGFSLLTCALYYFWWVVCRFIIRLLRTSAAYMI